MGNLENKFNFNAGFKGMYVINDAFSVGVKIQGETTLGYSNFKDILATVGVELAYKINDTFEGQAFVGPAKIFRALETVSRLEAENKALDEKLSKTTDPKEKEKLDNKKSENLAKIDKIKTAETSADKKP